MGYRTLKHCLDDLERHGQLKRIDAEIDPCLEMGVIQRKVYEAGGPALLFTNVKGCRFPMAGNIFGTMERTRFIFRDTLASIEAMVKAKTDPAYLFRNPSKLLKLPAAGLNILPKTVSSAPVMKNRIGLKDLPQLVGWQKDGGAFITLPQVYSESPVKGGFRNSNLGMYRVQISGNDYAPDEAGLHYQLHRGLGIHHTEALAKGERLYVNVFIGGAPSMTIAAVMPLPEGMPEISFAGALGGHRIPFFRPEQGTAVYAEADFVICGYIDGTLKPEGPFGDHVGYYSLKHDFPVMKVTGVFHRDGAIFPFTTVGRPPQEDTSFGNFIHELTGELIPDVLPGVKAVHAVDPAGVHPLLFAIGSERYTPYQKQDEPKEILTQANAILGQGQLSLAKYLFITNHADNPALDIHDAEEFFTHVLERADWRRDLHFQTSVTIDTLDYTGHGLNKGSKLTVAACGEKKRTLPDRLPENINLPDGFDAPKVVMNGVLAVRAPKHTAPRGEYDSAMIRFCESFEADNPVNGFPLIVLVDDSDFTAANINNFLWVTFTRSNPATDVYGIGAFTHAKHFGCTGSMVIDARVKAYHPEAMEMDEEVIKKVENMAVRGGALEGLF
ncbi:UbiD family decarboxylase [Seleniivibrio woodruffii]|uniref:UbiD family decarboxylase n=1 Tax=Seleniivibrio woodruffii TaxID=1078050 RepID=UPI00240A312A|nr:UbiD family decarboxylase [Seleniivibrio woodruffii]